MKKTLPFILLLLAALILVACQPTNTANTTNNDVVDNAVVDTTDDVVVEDVAEMPEAPALEIPYLEAWQSSGHADTEAEAFRHWDGDDPAVVPASCAKCHSQYGYQDFIGADGTEAGVMDAESFATDSSVTCVACHNEATAKMDSVMMPSGVELTGLGDESRCMQCHQGRASKFSIDEAVAELGDDDVSEELGFINIHYYAAAATKYGTMAKGGYEYEGSSYDGFFTHVEGYETCIDCHDSHTLEIKVEECAMCHGDADVKDFRMLSSAVDYDADGDMAEGIYYEIEGLQEILYAAMQAYAADTAGAAVVYESHTYPYFFNDTDGDGTVTEGEANYGNKYATWTPRLVKAAYNYQASLKDTGAYAHGGKYIIELLYDSIEDLGGDVTALARTDHGHFAGSEEAFRHWDEDGYEVPASCSRCHSAEGLPLFIEEGVSITQEASNGFLCSTCHNEEDFPSRYAVTSVTFPSGYTLETEEHSDELLCMQCHQGRSYGGAVDKATAQYGDNEVFEGRFINVHYFPAGATRYGADANGAYQYEGKAYAGYFEHVPGAVAECADCHDAHALEVKAETCAGCHGTDDLAAIRMSDVDFDGDGDVTEGIAGEVDGMRAALYAAIQAYATDTAGSPVVYESHTYPYFFFDTDGDGAVTPGEAIYPNQFNTWTPKLLKAAYNYQYATKDPGGFAHNGDYIIQVLYDSIQSLGGDVSGLTRP